MADVSSTVDHQLNVDRIPMAGSYRLDLRDGHLYWSPALKRIYGRDAPPADEDGFYQCIHPEDRNRVEAEAVSIAESGETYSHVFRILRPDGEIRTILDRGVVERDGDGRVLGFQGINIDISDDLIRSGLDPEDSLGADGVLHAARALSVIRAAELGTYELRLKDLSYTWSRELVHLLGHQAGDHSQPLDRVLEFIHSEDRERVRAKVIEAVRAPGAYDMEYRIVTGSGDVRWVRDRGNVAGPSPGGEPAHLLGLITDITDRKNAEAELRSMAGLFRAIFHNAPLGLAAFDRAFRFIHVNRKLADINGLPEAAHIGKRPDEILPGLTGLDHIYGLWRKILDGGPPVMNYELQGETDGSGARIWSEHFFPIVEEKHITGIAGIIEDVTEQRLAESVQQAAFDRLRRVLDSTIAMVGVLTPNGTMVEVNEVALVAGGLRREDVIGQKFWDAYWWNFDGPTVQQLKAAIAKAAGGERVRYDVEVRMAQDTRITIDFLLAPIFDANGDVEYLIPSGYDVTSRNRAIDQTKLLMQEVSHRSKNMLTLALSIARQTAKSDPKEFLSKYTDRLQSLAVLQDTLVRGHWNNIDLKELVRSQLLHFKEDIGDKIVLHGPPVMVSAEAAQSLALVIYELSTNSGKYGALSTGSGKVDITWSVASAAAGHSLSVDWVESGGPPVQPPTRRGFGFSLIHAMIETACSGKAESHFDPGGFRWHLRNARNCVVAWPAS